MEQERKKNKFWKKFCNGGGWALFIMFVWELIEEGLESLIAFTLSSAAAIFAAKALSALAVISATQMVKVSIKRFLTPLFKTLIYKEGKDKVNLLKNIFKLINANKGVLLSIIVGASSGFAGAYYLALTYLTAPLWVVYVIAGAVALLLGVLSIYLGGEKVADYARRISVTKLDEENKTKVNNVIDAIVNASAKAKEELAKAEIEAKAKAAEQAKLDADKKKALELAAKVESEAKAKAEQEAEVARLLALAAQIKAEEAKIATASAVTENTEIK